MNTFASDTQNRLKQMMLYFAEVLGALRDFTVGLSNDPTETKYVRRECIDYKGRPPVMYDLSCDRLKYRDRLARYVIVHSYNQFSLCEVQVFGFSPGMILLILL